MLIKLTEEAFEPSEILVNTGHIVAVRPYAGGGSLIVTSSEDEKGKPTQIRVKEALEEILKKARPF